MYQLVQGSVECAQVRASYLEIYNEEIRDLLGKDSKSKLELKEDKDKGVYVKDLNTFVVRNVKEIDHVIIPRSLFGPCSLDAHLR